MNNLLGHLFFSTFFTPNIEFANILAYHFRHSKENIGNIVKASSNSIEIDCSCFIFHVRFCQFSSKLNFDCFSHSLLAHSDQSIDTRERLRPIYFWIRKETNEEQKITLNNEKKTRTDKAFGSNVFLIQLNFREHVIIPSTSIHVKYTPMCRNSITHIG